MDVSSPLLCVFQLLAHTAPEEGYDLRAGTVVVGAEGGVAGALGDAVLHGPQHRIMIVTALGHVGEGHRVALRSGAAGSAPQEGYAT